MPIINPTAKFKMKTDNDTPADKTPIFSYSADIIALKSYGRDVKINISLIDKLYKNNSIIAMFRIFDVKFDLSEKFFLTP